MLTTEDIKRIAGDDVVYYRGAKYFRDGAVSNVTWSKAAKRYRAAVQGKNAYAVAIQIKEDNAMDFSCNCPDFIKKKKPCKHVVAALLFVQDYMERSQSKHRGDRDQKAMEILEYFKKQDFKEVYGETFEIKVSVSLPEILKENSGKAYVSLRVGNQRLYKIQNLKKFLSDYSKRETIALGKEFKFISGESRFSRKSQGILEYLLEIYEIQESFGKAADTNLFVKSEILLSKRMLHKFLSCIGGESFSLLLNQKPYDPVVYRKEDPGIKLYITAGEDEISLEYEKDYYIVPLTDDGSLLLYEGVVYEPSKDFLKNYLPLYSTLGKEQAKLRFLGEDKEKFLNMVLPHLHETMMLHIPKSMQEYYVDEELKISIYLDRNKNALTADLIFRYGSLEFRPLDRKTPDGVILIRKKEDEEKALADMEEFGFFPYKDRYWMKEEESIYQFLTSGLDRMCQQFTVYSSDTFRGIRVSGAGKVHSTVRLNKDRNLLEMDLTFSSVPEEELQEVFKSLQFRKKFHRLKDGSFIDLASVEAKKGYDILDALHLSYKNYNDGFEMERYDALYLEEYLKNTEQVEFQRDRSFTELVNEISGSAKAKYRVPEGILASLRPYQRVGFCWLRTLASNYLGGILADDMGLGKTLEAIVYMASFPGEKHLIVCPTSLIYNWQEECENFAPFLKTTVVCGAPENRKLLVKQAEEFDIIITSYPLIRRDVELYESMNLHSMFIDEAQFIKNPGSQNARAVKRIRASHKFALTGTPVENSLTELWSIFDFVMPGFLLNHSKFMENYERPIIRDENEAVLEALNQKIRPFILRRMKKDVLSELPEKIETRLVTEMTEKQSAVYFSVMAHIQDELQSAIQKNGVDQSRFQILSALTRLRQICCHPAVFVENYNGDSGKMELLMEQLPGILENGHRVLLFSQFTSMLHLIAERLDQEHITYFYLDGATKTKDRMHMVTRFNEGEKQVFLISLKAGGTGINLTGADTVIHYDPWWNPAVEEQATDRVYRIGQKNTVHVIRLLTKGTIEEKIFKLQRQKKELSDSVIASREIFINKLSRQEIEELFSWTEP